MLLTEFVYCVTIAFTNLLRFNGDFSFGKSQKLQGDKYGLKGRWQTWVKWCHAKKACMRDAEWAGALSWWGCNCSLGHSEWDDHKAHKLTQQHLTANLLAPRESDCPWTHSKVSSDWLPSYFKNTWPVCEIFKMDGYFPDSPCTDYGRMDCTMLCYSWTYTCISIRSKGLILIIYTEVVSVFSLVILQTQWCDDYVSFNACNEHHSV